MKIKYMLPLAIAVLFLISRTDRKPNVYIDQTVEIFQKVDDGIAQLDQQVAIIEQMTEQANSATALLASIEAVEDLGENLLAHEQFIADSAGYLGNIQLKRSSLQYLSATRQEVLPVYKRYFQARLQGVSPEEGTQQLNTSRKNFNKTKEALTAIIEEHQRHTMHYIAMLPIQLNKEGS